VIVVDKPRNDAKPADCDRFAVARERGWAQVAPTGAGSF
jgi:hypothetical protein